MLKKTSFWVPAVLAGVLIVVVYNTVFNRYSLSFLTVCGTSWWGIGRFLPWFLALAGILVVATLMGRRSSPRCKCGHQLEAGWNNCPSCGDEVT